MKMPFISERKFTTNFNQLKKSDLISRQAAIDALIRKTRPHDNGDGTTTICVMSEGLVREVITDLPTAEPRTGKWMIDNGLYRCSACKHLWSELWWAETVPLEKMLKLMPYCPNCGARMEESE